MTDSHNGLIWRRCSEGLRHEGNSVDGELLILNHAAAQAYAAQVAEQTGQGWRLPTVEELAGLVDRSYANPAINPKIFPATPSKWFWTASPRLANTQNAWSVGFNYGYLSYVSRTNTLAVHLVRDGPAPQTTEPASA